MNSAWRGGLILAMLLVIAGDLAAGRATERLPRGMKSAGGGVVETVIDGDTVVLADGREVRLVGIQAPKLPLGRPDFEAWPLADAAHDELEGLVLGKPVRLSQGGAPMDRHGRVLAHLHRDDGVWIQGEMLSRGLARVYTFRDNRALAAEMLAREREARAENRGLWALDYYAVRSPDGTPALIDSFQLVEGRVLDAADVKGQVYLNYGPDYRTDFTVSIARRDRRLFEKAGIDPLSLEGRLIRVRGWLSRRNGPMIEVTHPEQVEVLTEQSEVLEE